jgi:hypothetical protein
MITLVESIYVYVEGIQPPHLEAIETMLFGGNFALARDGQVSHLINIESRTYTMNRFSNCDMGHSRSIAR